MTTSPEAATQPSAASSPPGPFAAGCAWIDGEYLPIIEARIPILDAGFVRSDLTYDVVGVWDGSFFRLELGTQVVVARDTRRIPVGSVDPTVKNFHWGDLVRGLFEAYDRDAWLAILLDADGLVSERRGIQRIRTRGRHSADAGAGRGSRAGR